MITVIVKIITMRKSTSMERIAIILINIIDKSKKRESWIIKNMSMSMSMDNVKDMTMTINTTMLIAVIVLMLHKITK